MIYASDVWLNSYQVEQLIELAGSVSAASPIKFYLYRMSESSVMKEGSKMVSCCLLKHATVHVLLQSFYLLPKYYVCYIIVAVFLFGQVFGAQFTKANLKRYIGKRSKKVLVECSPSRTSFEVEMKMGSR